MKTCWIARFVMGVVLVMAGVLSASAQTYGTAADSASIRAIIADLDSAWAHADAERWASHYVADADFINILGMVMTDAKAMQARHDDIFRGVFKGSHHAGALRRLRFLDSTAAIADVDVQVTGFSALPPGSKSTSPGVLRTRMKHVLAKINDRWMIVASQNTAVAPGQ